MENNGKKEDQSSWKEFFEKRKKDREKKEHTDSSTNNQGTERNISLSIKGMSCTSCEMRIEKALEILPGLSIINVSYSGSTCSFTLDETETTLEKVIATIQEAGYEAILTGKGKEAGTEKKKDTFNIQQLIGIALIITAVFFILNKTGIFNMLPNVDKNIGYGLLFVIGVLTSVHCIAMCGGINITQSVKKTGDSKDVMSQLKPGFLYNIGRLISYTLIGGIVGAIGSFVKFSGNVQGIIIVVAGLFMIIMGINMIDIFPFLRKLTIKPPKFLTNKIGKITKGKGPFFVGLLNGLMPCGPLQTMQLYALSTGSFITGAFSMFLFSLGTIPLMFGFGALNALLAKKYTNRMLKISAILVLLLGVGMIGRGLSLSGIILSAIPDNVSAIGNIPTITDSEQFIESTLTSSSYEPIIVQKGLPVKWNIKAKDEDLNGCNNQIIIPSLNIKKGLVPGDNFISFTPQQSGKISFTCWMGMISSTILVVDDIAKVDKNALEDIQASSPSSAKSCCSTSGGSNLAAAKTTLDIDTNSIGYARIQDGVQFAEILVTKDGYTPQIIVMQRRVPTEWVFKSRELDDINYRINVPAYKSGIELTYEDYLISKFVPQIDFHFISWKGDFSGFVKVVDDLSTADRNTVQESAKNYNPAQFSGGGGCGGG